MHDVKQTTMPLVIAPMQRGKVPEQAAAEAPSDDSRLQTRAALQGSNVKTFYRCCFRPAAAKDDVRRALELLRLLDPWIRLLLMYHRLMLVEGLL